MKIKKQSLILKFILIEAAGIFLILGMSGILLYQETTGQAYREVENTARVAFQTFHEMIATDPHLFSKEQMGPIVVRLDDRIPNIQRITIMDRNGLIFSDSEGKDIGKKIEDSLLVNLTTGIGELTSYDFHDDGSHFHLLKIIRGQYDPIKKNPISWESLRSQ